MPILSAIPLLLATAVTGPAPNARGAAVEPGFLNTQQIRVHSTLPPFEFRLLGSEGSVDGVELRVPGAPAVPVEWPEQGAYLKMISELEAGRLVVVKTLEIRLNEGTGDLTPCEWRG